MGLFDQSFGRLQSTLQQLAISEQAQAIQLEDNRLTWLVYMIGEVFYPLATIGSIYLRRF